MFRRILEEGGLPLPETLDDVGFFAEHHTELPEPDCGEVLCLHGLLGVMGNLLNGANCTMMQVGMNARVPEEALQRKPLNLAIAIDTSGSMRAAGKMEFVRRGLELMVDNLEEGDEVTVVTYSNEARVVAEAFGDSQRDELRDIVSRLAASGGTNIHDGLQLAFEMVRRYQSGDRQNRVILLSDGMATVGITDDEAILSMAATFSEEGIGLTTIGVGTEFNTTLMRTLSESGSGNFYFLENEAAAEEVFVEELAYFVTPIATDLRVEIEGGQAYEFREAFGTKLWTTSGDGGTIEIPSVFVAHRQAHDDQERGRRGGGSAILLEMVPLPGWRDIADDAETVATVRFSYLPDGAALREEQEVTVGYPHDPGTILEDGFFDGGASIEKNFVMMNTYVGLRMAAERVERGDLDGAYSLLTVLEDSVGEWLGENHDEDIEDDLAVVRLFIRNLLESGAGRSDDEPEDPPDPWPQD